MKKFIAIVISLLLIYLAWDYAYYRMGWYIDLPGNDEISTFVRTNDKTIQLNSGNGYEDFEIRGVNLGSGIPGGWSTEFLATKDQYFRWFTQIKELNANCIRIYTVQNDVFYDALYEYNTSVDDPLYIIHGVWVNDYIQNSHSDAYDERFYDALVKDSRSVIDVLHGKKKISKDSMSSAGYGTYNKDVSPWVIGYILGVEWEDVTVAYTDNKYNGLEGYHGYSGKYMYTTEDATPFETMLAMLGDNVIKYESDRYNTQKLVAFSNWCTTDPFEYNKTINDLFNNIVTVDSEHIKTTDEFLTGQFASYHVYPYYPDYLQQMTEQEILDMYATTIDTSNGVPISISDEYYQNGVLNTYKLYLRILNNHHSMPVVISEFGVSTGRGIAQEEKNLGRNQGHMSEREQGLALVSMYNDIMDVGCAGGCVFSWQDEWFKRTWNTMQNVDLTRTPYWSDYQTNEQYFGLLSFDPGEEECVSYVDGDISEWTDNDIIHTSDEGTVSIKQDERYVYFMVNQPGFDFSSDKIYIPIDTTQKTGSKLISADGTNLSEDITTDRESDFVIVIDGLENSRMLVQQRYNALMSTYSNDVYGFDAFEKGNTPEKDTSLFVPINMILVTAISRENFSSREATDNGVELFESGKLKYGNCNPSSDDFDSLADFIVSEDGDSVEIKIPWQLLNCADPSRMNFHDDYFNGSYGIEYQHLSEMYVGLGVSTDEMSTYALEGWGNHVTYHERLKTSYYILQDFWGSNENMLKTT